MVTDKLTLEKTRTLCFFIRAGLLGRLNMIPKLTKRKLLEVLNDPRKVYISVFAQLFPAQTVPQRSRLMLAAAVMVSQTPRSEVRRRLRQGRFPFDQATSDTEGWVDTAARAAHDGLFSQRFPLYQLFAGFIAIFRSRSDFSFFFPIQPHIVQYPLFLPEDNTLPELTPVQFTQPSGVPTGSGHVLSLCSHNPASHT